MRTAVYFDLETGGLEIHHPDIQIAAIAIDESTWTEIDSFERKIVFPEAAADPDALLVNHYDRDVWAQEAKAEIQVVIEFARFLNRYRSLYMTSKRTGKTYTVAKLVAHYADFDGLRLQRLFRRHDEFLPADLRVRCTCQRAIWFFDSRGIPPPEDFQLATLCRYFGIPAPAAHEALTDVRLTISLAKAIASAEKATIKVPA